MHHLAEVELDPLFLLLFDQLERTLRSKVKAMGKRIRSSVVKSLNTQERHLKRNCEIQDSFLKTLNGSVFISPTTVLTVLYDVSVVTVFYYFSVVKFFSLLFPFLAPSLASLTHLPLPNPSWFKLLYICFISFSPPLSPPSPPPLLLLFSSPL